MFRGLCTKLSLKSEISYSVLINSSSMISATHTIEEFRSVFFVRRQIFESVQRMKSFHILRKATPSNDDNIDLQVELDFFS